MTSHEVEAGKGIGRDPTWELRRRETEKDRTAALCIAAILRCTAAFRAGLKSQKMGGKWGQREFAAAIAQCMQTEASKSWCVWKSCNETFQRFTPFCFVRSLQSASQPLLCVFCVASSTKSDPPHLRPPRCPDPRRPLEMCAASNFAT